MANLVITKTITKNLLMIFIAIILIPLKMKAIRKVKLPIRWALKE